MVCFKREYQSRFKEKDQPGYVEKQKPRYQIPKQSKKGKAKKAALKVVYQMIDRSRPAICEGCGDPNCLPLDHSHLASQKQYPDLACDPRNIKLHGRECHRKWHGEMPGREEMKDWKANLEYLLEKAPEQYHKMNLKKAA